MPYASKEKDLEYHREWKRRWRAANPEKAREENRKYALKAEALNPGQHYERLKRQRAENPENIRAIRRKSKFGLTSEDFQVMLARQSGLCDICGNEFSHAKRRSAPAVDHDHKTGEVRGVLCGKCNSLLGFAKDNIDILERASDYLKQFRKNN